MRSEIVWKPVRTGIDAVEATLGMHTARITYPAKRSDRMWLSLYAEQGYTHSMRVRCPLSPADGEVAWKAYAERILRALNGETPTPCAYWSDVDEETTHSSPDDFRDLHEANGGDVGHVFWCDPIVTLDREFYGVVPDGLVQLGEWDDGVYCGNTDLVGPFASEAIAKAEAERITEERKAQWEASDV